MNRAIDNPGLAAGDMPPGTLGQDAPGAASRFPVLKTFATPIRARPA